MSIESAVTALVGMAKESASAEKRRAAWKECAAASKATFQETINQINGAAAQRTGSPLGLVLIGVESRWNGQPAFGVSLSTESISLTETRKVGEAVETELVDVTEPTLALAPTYDGKIRAIARMSSIRIRDEVLSPAPAPTVLGEFEPQDLTKWQNVEDLLGSFLSLASAHHWTKRR